MKRVFITGGGGCLGRHLIDYLLSRNYIVNAPSSNDCNILNEDVLKTNIKEFNPDIVIHSAAFVDSIGCENDINKALNINVVGTINIVKACVGISCKFVYISSEYVFGGMKGQYTINDRLDPCNIYGKTKASAEYIVSVLRNYQIIRAPFIGKIHTKAFTDQYCSRFFIDDIIEKIVNNIVNNSDKIIHISSERMSLYETYIRRGIVCEPIVIPTEFINILPIDTSLVNSSI
jgi:dTDP-4-dehydrorhamnose reductase